MKNSQNQIKTFWKIPDAQQEKLLSLVETEQKELSDTLQSVLDQFGNTEMKGYLPRQKIERLYLAIRRWEQDGYDEGEMRLWMNDLKNRRRIRGEEAFFMFLFASMVDYNRAVAKRSLPFLTASAIAAYNHLYKINRHSPYLSITLHKCYPYYLFGISTFPSSVYHSIALRKFSITIV